MASLETLGVGSLSLRGANNEYHRISRFFASKTEAEASLANGSWVPVQGVYNACITAEDGILIHQPSDNTLHHLDSSIRPYIDQKVSDVIGGAPDTLDTLQELAAALADNPALVTTLETNLATEVTDRTTADSALDTRLVSAEGAITTLNNNVTNLQTSTGSGVMVQAHGSFDGSTAGSFDFANDAIASHNISGIVRNSAGNFTVTFANAMASGAYTVIAQAGDQDYSGVGASPRSVCVTNRTATTFDLIVERTDDAVNDDNGYVAFMVMGTLA